MSLERTPVRRGVKQLVIDQLPVLHIISPPGRRFAKLRCGGRLVLALGTTPDGADLSESGSKSTNPLSNSQLAPASVSRRVGTTVAIRRVIEHRSVWRARQIKAGSIRCDRSRLSCRRRGPASAVWRCGQQSDHAIAIVALDGHSPHLVKHAARQQPDPVNSAFDTLAGGRPATTSTL